MSVRRLADTEFQPGGFAFSRANASWAKKTIGKYPKGRQHSAVIPLLMRAQEQEGWVTKSAIETVADMLDMPYIRALEVATFYTQFQLKPVGTKAHVQVCGTTPCMLRGSEALIEVCRKRIHAEPLHTNEAGTLSWEEVECQGACVNAPMVMIFKDTYEDLTPERLEEIIDAFEKGRGKSIEPGPQIDRVFSAPASGLTSLKNEKSVTNKGRRAAARGKNGDGGTVPPSRAAKPRTDAPETSPALNSPSTTKASSNGEKRASVKTPSHDEKRADRAASESEGDSRPRHHADEHRPAGKSRKAVGATMSVAETARGIGGDRPSGADRKVEKPVNPTMAIASTASGRAARDVTARSPEDRDRPAAIARPQKPDDLKLISGVGPKLEATLNDLGIHTYAQVASWKKAERDWVDNYLRFKGRIERDDWVKQAKALARGGEAEYVRVFGRKPR